MSKDIKEMRDLDLQLSGCTTFKAVKSQCKGPETGSYLVYLRNNKGSNVAGEWKTRGRVVGDKLRQAMGGKLMWSLKGYCNIFGFYSE